MTRHDQAEATIEIERSLVSSLSLDGDARLHEVVQHVSEPDFLDPVCAAVFSAQVRLAATGLPLDLPHVVDELARSGQLQRVNAGAGIAMVLDECATGANVRRYAALVRRQALGREQSQLHQGLAHPQDGEDAERR